MGDMAEVYEAMALEAKARREKEEGPRIAHSLYQLERIGCKVKDHDPWSFKVEAPNGLKFHYWPWKGWWQGPTHGRGLSKLIRACKSKGAPK